MSYLSNDALRNRLVGISRGNGSKSKDKMLLFYYALKLANLPHLAEGALNELKYMEIDYYNDLVKDSHDLVQERNNSWNKINKLITNKINFYKDLVKDSHDLVDEWNHSEYQRCQQIELNRNLIVIRQIMINIENRNGWELLKAPFSTQNILFSILFSWLFSSWDSRDLPKGQSRGRTIGRTRIHS